LLIEGGGVQHGHALGIGEARLAPHIQAIPSIGEGLPADFQGRLSGKQIGQIEWSSGVMG
jgi:hypothetical protein